MTEIRLLETMHPDKDAEAVYRGLVGIDGQKQQLLDELVAQLRPDRVAVWMKKFHPEGLALSRRWQHSAPLVLMSGDVGCGKTALANSVGSPLAHAIDKRVVTLETPSDLRGWGHVGELSARVTDAFSQARRRAKDVGAGLLVIDEADDVATARAQNQAHHEDRAGLNVLIKQIDQVARAKDPLVVLLITNRHAVLDPAIRRRTALHLGFNRPDARARAEVFAALLDGVKGVAARMHELVEASARTSVPFSYSDLTDRLGRTVLREAQRENVAVSVDLVLRCLTILEPSPLMDGRDG